MKKTKERSERQKYNASNMEQKYAKVVTNFNKI